MSDGEVRDYVSRLWAEDWDSDEDAVYDQLERPMTDQQEAGLDPWLAATQAPDRCPRTKGPTHQ